MIVYEQYIRSEGSLYEVRKEQNGKFSIFNTQKKQDRIKQDGIGYYVSCDPFDSLEEAKEYLNKLVG